MYTKEMKSALSGFFLVITFPLFDIQSFVFQFFEARGETNVFLSVMLNDHVFLVMSLAHPISHCTLCSFDI